MPKMPEKLCRCQASRLLFHRIMDTKENCVFCEYFVLPASGQMGVFPRPLEPSGLVVLCSFQHLLCPPRIWVVLQVLVMYQPQHFCKRMASFTGLCFLYSALPSKEVLWHTHPGLPEPTELIIFNNILGIISGWCIFAFVLMSSCCCSSVSNTPFYVFPASATLNDHGILGKATGNYIMVPTSLGIDFSTGLLVSETENCW